MYKVLLFLLVLFHNLLSNAQNIKLISNIELQTKRKEIIKNFEDHKSIIKNYLEESNEDATSTWYNIYYSINKKLLKIRTIWNGGCCQNPIVTDLYYKDTSLILLDDFIGEPKDFNKKKIVDNLIKGKKLQLKLDESLLYKKNHLIGYYYDKTSENREPEPEERERWGLELGEMKNDFDYFKLKK